MKPLLFGLLAVSLAVNLLLAWRARPAASAAQTMAAVAGNSSTAVLHPASGGSGPRGDSRSGTAASSPAASAPAWQGGTSDQNLRQLVAELRSAGYPASVIRAVVIQLLKERFASRQPDEGRPYWKGNVPSPEMIAAQNVLAAERRELFEALLGTDARPSALLDDTTRQRRYGSLASDKIDAIAKIETDYNEMTAETWAKRLGNLSTSIDTTRQSQQLIEQEKLADIAALLSPEELAQYELRNSASARNLMNNLRNVDVSETEYARLYEVQKTFDAANPPRSSLDSDALAKRRTAQSALNEQVHSVLGEERFYSYLEGADFLYALTAQALKQTPGVTPAATYQVYQMQTALQNLLAVSSHNGAPSKEKTEEMRTKVNAYNTQLETLLGPAAAAAYRKQNQGRIFNSFGPLPGVGKP